MNKLTEPVTIVICDFAGSELERIEIPARPLPSFWERVRWHVHCWRIGLKNVFWRLRGAR